MIKKLIHQARNSLPVLVPLLFCACSAEPEAESRSSAVNTASSAATVVSSASSLAASSSVSSLSISSVVSSSSLVVSSSSLKTSSSSMVSSNSSALSIGNNIPLIVAINAGSTAAASYEGVEYKADKYSNGGSTNSTADPIAGVAEDIIFQSERWGSYSYKIPVTNGTYSLELHLAEIYHQAAGKRSFDLSVEGKVELRALDLYSQVGHDGAFNYIVKDVKVSDGILDIALNGLVDAGTISGFAIYSADGKLDTSVPASNCKGYVGITYDDGPVNTTAFVNALKSANLVPVTFFVNGIGIAGKPGAITQMLSVGYVQSHLYTHTNMVNSGYSYDKAKQELQKNNDAIVGAGAPKPTIFRPPNGASNAEHRRAASDLGMITINWDNDSQDWNGASVAAIVTANGRLQNGQVILMHENQNNSLQAIPQIAADLKARGFCPGKLDPKTGKAIAP